MEEIYDKFKDRIDKKLFEEIYNAITNTEEIQEEYKQDLSFDYIMEQIELFKNKKTNLVLSQTSIKNYKSKYNKLNELHPNIIEDIINDINVDEILNEIKAKYPKSYKDYITILIKIIDNVANVANVVKADVYKKLQNIMVEGLIQREKQTDIKIEEEPLKIKWEDYVRGVKNLLNNEEAPLRLKILYQLYRELTIRDDFYDVLLTNEKIENQSVNYYNMNAKKFFLNKYKTEGKYGKQVYTLSSKLNNLIKQYYKEGHKYLLENDKNEKYKSLSKLVSTNSKKYFDKKFGINDIRKSIISFYNETKSIQERKQLSKFMLHDWKVQQEVYLRNQNLPYNYVVTKENLQDINLERKKFVKQD